MSGTDDPPRRTRRKPTAQVAARSEPGPAPERGADPEDPEAPDAVRHVPLKPPPGGATVRMYRIGHGDCFLLGFPGKSRRTVHVLIDCGYKPGSPKKMIPPRDPATIAADIRAVTKNKLDVAIITHEHQDHVNGITEDNFPEGFEIGEAWFAWTEDGKDDVANALRRRHHDQLVGLAIASSRLALSADAADRDRSRRVADLVEFELGDDHEKIRHELAAGRKAEDSANKRSMARFKKLAGNRVKCFQPGTRFELPETDVTVYVLGPPRDLELLRQLEPEGSEAFGKAHAMASLASYFAAAADPRSDMPPFMHKYVLPAEALSEGSRYSDFFVSRYGAPRPADIGAGAQAADKATDRSDKPDDVAADAADFRRIDRDWLYASEGLALDMSDDTNNGSLVLAFELGRGGKVLLFAADAQAGNWRSWSRYSWPGADGKTVTVADLLARTVLYKVGHHGSHNATLKGVATDPSPNLGWMALREYADEFTAMITAVPAWARTQKGWEHPLPEIREALMLKAAGRVLQTDLAHGDKPISGSSAFGGRLREPITPIYYDLEVRK